jgi:Fe2+ transport system protein B
MTSRTLKKVYRIPLLLGTITIFGLLSALLGDGVWDGISWILLAVPLLLVSFFLLRSRKA